MVPRYPLLPRCSWRYPAQSADRETERPNAPRYLNMAFRHKVYYDMSAEKSLTIPCGALSGQTRTVRDAWG